MKRILKVLCTFFLSLCSMLVMNISVFASGNDGDAIELDDDYYEKMIQKNNTEHYKLHAEFLEN